MCLCLVAQSIPTLRNPMDCSMPSFPVLHHFPELAYTRAHWGSDATNHLILCHSSCPPSSPASGSFPMSWLSWPKHWSFSFSISPFNEYSGLISFRVDWFDLLAVPGTLKSLLQHHHLQHHQFFGAKPFLWSNSQPYVITGPLSIVKWCLCF